MNWLLVLLCFILLILLADNASAADTVTLQDSLVSIIQQVQSGVSAGVDFLKAEIPDVLKQLLLWKLVEALVWTTACIIAAVAALWGLAWGISKKPMEQCDPGCFFFCLACAAIGSGLLFNGLLKASVALQIWIAPKVWLIEYAASLVK